MPGNPFLFVTCQVGAEPALKKELAREHPELRFAYSRPGFVTFKRVDNQPIQADFELRSVFARAYGQSIGKAVSSSQVIEQAQLVYNEAGKPLRLHVWERDRFAPGEEPKGFAAGSWAGKWKKSIAAVGSPLFASGELAAEGESVFDLVILDGDGEGNEAWMGTHIHSRAHSPYPGGNTPIELPAEAPSRAYLKLEESVRWAQAPLKAGDVAVEIGSAPGGASYALLQRGISVVGIDPGDMDPRVLRFRSMGNPGEVWFKHIQKTVATVPRESLPASIHWLLLDMNVAPSVSLFAVDRLVSRIDSLLGVLLTVKLNDWKFADQIPSMLDHVKAMGMVRIRAAQLSHHRQEIAIFGLTRKGLLRLQKER